ncbi:MAG: ABC-F family ATP-binding cassette domain-containing protein [Actinomycetales bacterium]
MAGRNLVNLEKVRVELGAQVILDDVSLGVAEGQRIGVVGRNGGGKSTLLDVLVGRRQPDAGRVTHVGGLDLAHLTQRDSLDPDATVRQALFGDAAEHEWASQSHIRDVLTGLLGGLDAPSLPAGLESTVGVLSGGERRRTALAALLIGDHDLVVLDEPTNHLDVEGIDWLARHLRDRRGALVVVTHDRWFLDLVSDAMWEVHDTTVDEYEGGYSAYVLARAERARIAAADEARRQNLLRKELAWLRRGPPARTSKPRFRIDAANALIADEQPARDSVELLRFATQRLGRTVYDIEDATLRVGDRDLLRRLTWQVGPGDRIGIVGVNGAGKTSLLRMVQGLLPPASGTVKQGVTVKPAYLSQDVAEIPADRRVLEAVEEIGRSVTVGKRELSASSLLDTFGFTGERQWTRVGDLSGGERRRLQLLRLLMSEPNVLVLDEPTNDLDIDTLTALEDLLDGFPGTLLVVSHDRWFLERVADRTMALLGDGRLRDLPGGVEEYLALRAATPGPNAAAGGGATASGSGARVSAAGAAAGSVADGEQATDGGEADGVRDVSPAQRREARKELARLERVLEKLGAEEARLHEQLAAKATDFAAVAELDARLREVVAEREGVEEQWLEAAELAG